jgi:hypothetical protein
LIGPRTHTREWVDFEIREAQRQGKRIIGIYTHGSMETAEVPPALKEFASSIIGWNSIEKLGELIAGQNLPFEDPDGNIAIPIFSRPDIGC